jgi:hypothetical protein
MQSREDKNLYNKRYRAENKERIKLARSPSTTSPQMSRENAWKRQGIDITHDEYMCMFIEQNGCCKICKKNQEDLKIALCVDHDHVTGYIRGLLCNKCNSGLGFFNDDAFLVAMAADYLRGNK